MVKNQIAFFNSNKFKEREWNMKRIFIGIIVIVTTLAMVACGNTTSKPSLPDLYIEKAQLTEQEESIAKLLGANEDQYIFDFALDDQVKSIQVNSYELTDGSWKLVGGGDWAFSDEKGRIALEFENLAEGLRVAIQSKHSSGSTQYQNSTELAEEFTKMSRVTSILTEQTGINYEQEIPLVIQFLTSRDSVSSYEVDTFFTPEIYETYGYEHIYAITMMFSQKSPGEFGP